MNLIGLVFLMLFYFSASGYAQEKVYTDDTYQFKYIGDIVKNDNMSNELAGRVIKSRNLVLGDKSEVNIHLTITDFDKNGDFSAIVDNCGYQEKSYQDIILIGNNRFKTSEGIKRDPITKDLTYFQVYLSLNKYIRKVFIFKFDIPANLESKLIFLKKYINDIVLTLDKKV
jgi:hypothetical protein